MTEPQETFEVGDKTVKLYQDEDPSSPREDDNLGHMICWHRRNNLGDEKLRPADIPPGAAVREWLIEERKAHIILPIYIYEHGQITVTAREEVYARYPDKQWDAGQVGFIYATEAAIKETYMEQELTAELLEKATESLRCEVDTYDQYLMGDVWGFVIEDADGEHLDSCWGFYGLEYAKEEATSAAEAE